MRGDFFFNGGIYLTKELTENPLKEANCLVIILNLRPGSDLLKLDFHPRQCRIMVKALIWESGDLTLGLGK